MGYFRRKMDKFVRKHFLLWEKYGYHITVNHFLSPIPDTTELSDSLWSKPSELVGVEINEKAQIDLVRLFASKFKNEFDSFPLEKTTDLKNIM